MGYGFEIYRISYGDSNDSPVPRTISFSEDIIAKCNRRKINLGHQKQTILTV